MSHYEEMAMIVVEGMDELCRLKFASEVLLVSGSVVLLNDYLKAFPVNGTRDIFQRNKIEAGTATINCINYSHLIHPSAHLNRITAGCLVPAALTLYIKSSHSKLSSTRCRFFGASAR